MFKQYCIARPVAVYWSKLFRESYHAIVYLSYQLTPPHFSYLASLWYFEACVHLNAHCLLYTRNILNLFNGIFFFIFPYGIATMSPR